MKCSCALVACVGFFLGNDELLQLQTFVLFFVHNKHQKALKINAARHKHLIYFYWNKYMYVYT